MKSGQINSVSTKRKATWWSSLQLATAKHVAITRSPGAGSESWVDLFSLRFEWHVNPVSVYRNHWHAPHETLAVKRAASQQGVSVFPSLRKLFKVKDCDAWEMWWFNHQGPHMVLIKGCYVTLGGIKLYSTCHVLLFIPGWNMAYADFFYWLHQNIVGKHHCSS